MISPLLQSVARALLPLALLVAMDLLLRGHNLPGGGFVAGLMTAAALILQFVATDRRVAERGLPCRPETLIWLGLACAGGTAVAALLLGYPLLTSAFGHVEVPLLGHFEASTAFGFDLGVYFVVTGVTLAILIAIEE
jgi:multicomponent K+:H+ antiporter subunit A